jgi:UDPglucose--hexose-1-phosphate uridylyltransferase
MGGITFERWSQRARFHSPLKGGQLDEQEIEIRVDPITGYQSIFNLALEEKSSVLFHPTDMDYLRLLAKNTEPTCFLCNDRWSTTTPRYEENLFPEGRLRMGEVVAFPNLFPLAAYHAVIMLGARHFRTLDDFPPSLLRDAFECAREFIRRCMEKDPEVEHFTINANYLLPSGSSVMHPHFQILGSPRPFTHPKLLLDRSASYLAANGSCYWEDLVNTERLSGERWIGKMEGSCWFSAYSPMGVNEINAVWPEKTNFLEWDSGDLEGFSLGLSRVLHAYHDLGFSTFNFSCFGGPVSRHAPEFRCFFRLINRQNMAQHYRADDYYLQKLLQNEIMIQRPERLAEIMRGYFKSTS